MRPNPSTAAWAVAPSPRGREASAALLLRPENTLALCAIRFPAVGDLLRELSAPPYPAHQRARRKQARTVRLAAGSEKTAAVPGMKGPEDVIPKVKELA